MVVFGMDMIVGEERVSRKPIQDTGILRLPATVNEAAKAWCHWRYLAAYPRCWGCELAERRVLAHRLRAFLGADLPSLVQRSATFRHHLSLSEPANLKSIKGGLETKKTRMASSLILLT